MITELKNNQTKNNMAFSGRVIFDAKPSKKVLSEIHDKSLLIDTFQNVTLFKETLKKDSPLRSFIEKMTPAQDKFIFKLAMDKVTNKPAVLFQYKPSPQSTKAGISSYEQLFDLFPFKKSMDNIKIDFISKRLMDFSKDISLKTQSAQEIIGSIGKLFKR